MTHFYGVCKVKGRLSNRMAKAKTIRPRQSFYEGIASIVDLGGTLQGCTTVYHSNTNRVARGVPRTRMTSNQHFNLSEAVAQSLVSDWRAISHDLGVAAIKLERKYVHRLDGSVRPRPTGNEICS